MVRCSCDTANQSVASFCMKCGAALGDVVNKEITQLRNEKTVLENQISELKEQNSEKTKLETDKIIKLEKQLQEKSKEQPESESKRKPLMPAALGTVFFAIISLFFAITSMVKCSDNNSLEQKIHRIENSSIPPLQAEHDFIPKDYKSIVDIAYFYDSNFNRTKNHIRYGERVKIVRVKDNFGYGICTDTKGVTILGWVRMGDISSAY